MSVVCGKKLADVLGKILQVLILAAIVLLVASLFVESINSSTAVYILIIVYIAYLIAEFCSTICSFLCHKTNEMGIKNIMQNLIRTPPVIEFYCECYHYETRVVRYSPPKRGGGGGGGRRGGGGGKRTGGGGSHHTTRTHVRRERIVTYRETADMPYYSARDVSGLFELNKSREAAMGKVYVKLELTPEINFADELTYMDYELFRSDFYNRNRPRDQYMTYRETRRVPGLNNFNFVNIRDQEPCGVNICLFIIFTIIPLAEFYKCYVNSYCLEQQFKIRKLISTRYDLNQDQYQYFVPSFNLPTQQYAFDPANYNYINNDYQVKKPTSEEISQAAMYKDKIPQYNCVSYTSINDQIKVGVVQDDPAYCSLNINEAPPPNCQDIGPQPDNNNMNANMNMNGNMNMNMNVNVNNNMNMNMNMNSNNALNNNMYNNYNNQNDESYSEENNQGYGGY